MCLIYIYFFVFSRQPRSKFAQLAPTFWKESEIAGYAIPTTRPGEKLGIIARFVRTLFASSIPNARTNV